MEFIDVKILRWARKIFAWLVVVLSIDTEPTDSEAIFFNLARFSNYGRLGNNSKSL